MADFNYSLGFDIPSENTVSPTYKYKGGFPAGYQLPAPHFNWIVDKTSKSITELQECFNIMVGGKFTEGTSVPIKSGGTGARTRKNAMANIAFLGVDPITESSDDTPQKWISLGTGYAWVSPSGKITDRPTDYAIVVNVVHSGDLTQFWIAQPIGRVYKRSGSTAGWNDTWFKSYDEKNKPTPNELGVESLSGGTAIQANTDLNTLKTMGNYHCDNDTRVGTLTNCPVKNAFRMKVGNPTGSTAYVYQEIYHYMSGARYYRQCLASGGKWTEWVKTYDTSNKPTPAEIGAVPIGYGFAESAKFISNTSLVDVLSTGKSGFYKGTNITGAPTTDEWWIFEIICHDEKYATVMAYQEAGTDVYHMFYRGGVLGNWYKVHTSAEAIPIENGGTGATNAAKALQNLGITATAAELNYVDGVTSNVQTQLNGKSPTTHGHALTDSNITGILPIPKGGTGATDVPNARKNLNFISGTYYGTGNSGGGNMYNFDTGARGSNVIMIHGINARGFLCPWGGFMVYDNGAGVLSPTEIQAFGQNSGEYASYSDGYISLKTSHDYINVQGGVFQYWCL